MFGDLIEKAQRLSEKVIRLSLASSRKRARFEAAAAIYASLILIQNSAPVDERMTREELREEALAEARSLEAALYEQDGEDEVDFDT